MEGCITLKRHENTPHMRTHLQKLLTSMCHTHCVEFNVSGPQPHHTLYPTTNTAMTTALGGSRLNRMTTDMPCTAIYALCPVRTVVSRDCSLFSTERRIDVSTQTTPRCNVYVLGHVRYLYVMFRCNCYKYSWHIVVILSFMCVIFIHIPSHSAV
jgi:hypothetical protein